MQIEKSHRERTTLIVAWLRSKTLIVLFGSIESRIPPRSNAVAASVTQRTRVETTPRKSANDPSAALSSVRKRHFASVARRL